LTPILTAFIARKRKIALNAKNNAGSGTDEEKILVVADDFTGANDTGVQFSKRKLKSIVITNKDKIIKSLRDCDVLVIDTESRFDDREMAYKKAFEIGKIIKEKNIRCIYKKLDSTFRGNIGAEISGLMDSLEIEHAIIVPAFPSNQRVTKNGMVYVKGKLLAEKEVADDPRTPVRESYMPKIISQQTDKSIGLINFKDVQAGERTLIQKVQQHINNGIRMIIIDAQSDEDLDLIASVTAPMKKRNLFVGSPGLAEYLPKYLEFKNEKKCNVVFAGSVSEVTREQIDYAITRLAVTLIDIEIEKLFTGEQHEEKIRILNIVKESSCKGRDIIVRTAPSKAFVSETFEKGQKYGLSGSDVSEIIACFLGEIAREIIQGIEVNGILITGGDTAIKIAQALNISGVIIRDEIQSGIPFGCFIEEQYKHITIVSKAGGFGSTDAIFQVLNYLSNGRKG
jgi:D-threonate/D-erythronate kinase